MLPPLLVEPFHLYAYTTHTDNVHYARNLPLHSSNRSDVSRFSINVQFMFGSFLSLTELLIHLDLRVDRARAIVMGLE